MLAWLKSGLTMEINQSFFKTKNVILVGKVILRMDTLREADSRDEVLYGGEMESHQPTRKTKKAHPTKNKGGLCLLN